MESVLVENDQDNIYNVYKININIELPFFNL